MTMVWPTSPGVSGSRVQSTPTTPSHMSHGRSKSMGISAVAGMPGLAGLGSVPMSPGGSASLFLGAETEWADIQARTFCKWLNTKLEAQSLEPMEDLVKDFSNGVKLIQLLEIMSETSLGRYNKKPVMRVQKAENAAKALNFIRERGVKLTNIGPEDIVDGNMKLILGMIWTLILRFTIATITEEGLSAKDGLLLWCQRKTQGYEDVQVKDFKKSFANGLALCALLHRHRPDLLNFEELDKADPRGNTEKAFAIAEAHLGIPRFLEVSDLCDVDVPDERSVMTYVAEFFHKFSSEDRMETGSRRVVKFAELMQGIWTSKNDFERRMSSLMAALDNTASSWSVASTAATYNEAIHHLATFAEYKKREKRSWVKERQELAALYSNIQTKLRTYALRDWQPQPGLRLEDLEQRWTTFVEAEKLRSRSINARIREIKETLRQDFARAAEDFVQQVQRVEQAIGSLQGSLADQNQTLQQLSELVPDLRAMLDGEIRAVNDACLEAKIEENDYTVLTYDDLQFELELAEAGIRKKIAFVENQMVSATHTNLTPAKLEEFEATFKHFDKEEANTLQIWEMHSALASLGIVYTEDEMDRLYAQLEKRFGAATYEAWLALLTDITRDDSSSPAQLREAFISMAQGKHFVTEGDMSSAALPRDIIRFLEQILPSTDESSAVANGHSRRYDFQTFLEETFR